MATLYVENVPDDLYEALRNRAKAQHRSIAAEVLALLEQNVPTAQELKEAARTGSEDSSSERDGKVFRAGISFGRRNGP